MADEQTPNSDLIEDALRQAERQLEERLEALRMSALGEPSAPASAPDPDVAVLRPTGVPSASSDVFGGDRDEAAGDVIGEPGALDSVWSESTDTGDLRFEPTGANPLLAPEPEAIVPNLDDEDFVSPRPLEPTNASSIVNELTTSWSDLDDESEDGFEDETSSAASGIAMPDISFERRPEPESAPERRPEPVHTSWTATGRERAGVTPAAPTSVVPTEDEMQFWAHTRTALRSLQQASDAMPSQITSSVTEDVERIVHDEVATAAASIRLLQQAVQQGLPKVVDRVEGAIEQAIAAPNSALRQLRDELPSNIDRGGRELRVALREDLERSASTTHGALQKDVAQLEQSIAANVTRMAQSIGDNVTSVERDVEQLGESIVRFERGMHGEFDRVESQLRSTIERVEASLRDELVEPTETVRKLDEELPARFGRIERTFTEQVQTTQRDLSGVLTTLVDVNRAALDRLAAMASTQDEERVRRSEDTELIVDTVTTGWEALAGAVKALYTQNEALDRRIDQMEQRLAKLRDVEKAVDGTLRRFDEHIADLAPAPVVVTVSHPEASVQNTSKGGWTPGGK